MVSLLLCCNTLLSRQKHSKGIANVNQKKIQVKYTRHERHEIINSSSGDPFMFTIYANSAFIVNKLNIITLGNTSCTSASAVNYIWFNKPEISVNVLQNLILTADKS